MSFQICQLVYPLQQNNRESSREVERKMTFLDWNRKLTTFWETDKLQVKNLKSAQKRLVVKTKSWRIS